MANARIMKRKKAKMERKGKKVLRLPSKIIDREVKEMIRKCDERKDTHVDWTKWRELLEPEARRRYAPFLEGLDVRELMNTKKGRIRFARILEEIKSRREVK